MRLEVYLNARGERRFVGLLEERGGDILFEYDKRFLDSGIELSPFLLPLRPGVASDPKRTFDGLFGVFNDSLPDGWGLLLLDRLLRRSGLPLERITPLSRLSLVGSGGMGALEYEPVTPDPDPLPERIDLDGVAEEAWRTLNEDPLPVETLRTLMALNGSSCGARPKIMVRVSGDRRLIVPDAVAEPGCDPWLIKFPARHDDPAIGRMEYACSLAAKRAGIEMPETALFPGRDGAAYFGACAYRLRAAARLAPVRLPRLRKPVPAGKIPHPQSRGRGKAGPAHGVQRPARQSGRPFQELLLPPRCERPLAAGPGL